MKQRCNSPLAWAVSSLLACGTSSIYALPSADSAYNKDKTLVFVNEKSGEVFENINEILCEIEQTRYSDSALVNQDWQRVLVDSSLCKDRDSTSNSGASAGSGSTSSSGSKSYNTWLVKSERLLGADAPHVVSAFVHKPGEMGGPAMTIQARMEVTEAASEANPTGLFNIAFKGLVDGMPAEAPPVVKGILKAERNGSGQVVVRWTEETSMGPDGGTTSTKAALIKTTTSGQGSVYQNGIFIGPGVPLGEHKFNFQYDENFFRRVNPAEGKEQCLSRTQFETSAWRYGLYDSESGNRVAVNSGFPINTSPDGAGSFGYLGYYGLFLPPGSVALGDGAKVYKNMFEGGMPVTTEYTLAIKGGKLKKHERKAMTLEDIKNIPIEGTIMKAGEPPGAQMSLYRLTWDGTNLAVRAKAVMTPGQPPSWQKVDPPQNFESFPLAFPDVMFYSEALGGDVRIKMNCHQVSPPPSQAFACDAPAKSTAVYFFKITTVTNDAGVPSRLVCYDNCPKGPIMSAADPSYPMSFPSVQRAYTFSELLLRENGSPLELTSAADASSYGFNSGPLFEETATNMAQIACDFDPGQICGHKAYELENFYTWETGPNNYNKLTLALDGSGVPVAFDPPVPVNFVYPTTGTGGVNPAQIDSKYSGAKFFLQYGGFGELQGVPGKCSNPENPTDTDPDCSRPGRRWVPEFTIPNGSIVTGQSGSYLVKPLEIEQRMSVVDPAQCAGLNPTDMSGNWPDMATEWVDPALGAEPNVSTPPKVIAGVVQ